MEELAEEVIESCRDDIQHWVSRTQFWVNRWVHRGKWSRAWKQSAKFWKEAYQKEMERWGIPNKK